jgi:hypothetical protein
MGDLLTGPRLPHTIAIKSLLRRTFKPQARTEPIPLRGGSRLKNGGALLKVEGIGVGGSVARGDDDEGSDLDLFVLVKDGIAVNDFDELAVDLALTLGEVVTGRGPVYLPEFGYCYTYLYEDLAMLQLNVNTFQWLTPPAYTEILFDEHGRLGKKIEEAGPFEASAEEVFVASYIYLWERALPGAVRFQRRDLAGDLVPFGHAEIDVPTFAAAGRTPPVWP